MACGGGGVCVEKGTHERLASSSREAGGRRYGSDS